MTPRVAVARRVTGRESDFYKRLSSDPSAGSGLKACRGTSNYFARPCSLWTNSERSFDKLRMTALLGSAFALAACSSAVTPDKIAQIKPAMSASQVEAILGRPASIEQSETSDRTISGEVDHYPAPNGEGRVTYVNHVVFKAEFVPGAKS